MENELVLFSLYWSPHVTPFQMVYFQWSAIIEVNECCGDSEVFNFFFTLYARSSYASHDVLYISGENRLTFPGECTSYQIFIEISGNNFMPIHIPQPTHDSVRSTGISQCKSDLMISVNFSQNYIINYFQCIPIFMRCSIANMETYNIEG
jgi:hypothetical protein